jgi:hypothetical protein
MAMTFDQQHKKFSFGINLFSIALNDVSVLHCFPQTRSTIFYAHLSLWLEDYSIHISIPDQKSASCASRALQKNAYRLNNPFS